MNSEDDEATNGKDEATKDEENGKTFFTILGKVGD